MSEPIRIDVWSDVACPWCYIGKRQLEAGLDAFAADERTAPVHVEYHSFELAPDTPVDVAGGEVDFLVHRKGIAEPVARRMLERVRAAAEAVGLHYDFDALQHTNTGKAHQLLHYAKAHGRQREAKERLLRAYFVEGRHVGRDDDLADLAVEVGLDRDDVLRSLREDEHLPAVRADRRRAVELGISGVPFAVIDGRYGISGAQPAEAFHQALRRVLADRHDQAVA